MLNKQKGNMYGFITHTWNPVKGECSHQCKYCYMRRFPQKPIRLDDKCFNDNLGEDHFIFIGSSTDLFASDVPKEWIQKVIDYCGKYQLNRYLFQSKNPARFHDFKFSRNMVLGTTLESNHNIIAEHNEKCPYIIDRAKAMIDIRDNIKMVTIEPVMDFSPYVLDEILHRIDPYQVNIGADSGGNDLFEPDKFKLELLISLIKANENIRLVLKDNLKRLL